MSDEAEDKELDPTPRRQTEMRQQGKTLRSKDLSSAILLASAIMMILFMSDSIVGRIQQNFTQLYSSIPDVVSNQPQLFKILKSVVFSNFLMLIPFFVMLMGMAFCSVFFVGGWNFSLQVISFNLGKIDPLKNFFSIFSKRMFVDVAKSSIKFAIIMGFFVYFVIYNQKDIISLSYLELASAITVFCSILKKFIMLLFTGVGVIVAIDILISYFTFKNANKMSLQEVKDEYKQSEGDGSTKRKIKSLRRKMAKQRILQLVPTATVVITNPTHYAVALRYRENQDRAPIVVAKGKGHIAQYIRQIALTHGVTIYEEPPLARAIYFTSKLGATINPELYMAVAFVLTYINQLRRYQYGQGPLPNKMEINLPPEYLFKG